jgi:uncharacterized HAD superfamily protein
MGGSERLVDDCPHRVPLSTGDRSPVARCGLLASITGLLDPQLTCVTRDACEACCRSFPPSVDEFNPVVASLLYDLSARIVDQGGRAGCDVGKARALNRRAVLDVPTEEDCLKAPARRTVGSEGSAPGPSYRSFNDLCRCVQNGLKHIPGDIDIVVGIPRSGMLVANLIALKLNKHLADIDSFINGRVFRPGRRLEEGGTSDITKRARRILVVDDSVNTGHEMQRARTLLVTSQPHYNYLFAAAYARRSSASLVDISFEICECPRLFEWNFLHHSYLQYAMLDIDGFLCVDPTDEENDDGPRYLRFLDGASSLLLPTVPVGALVTCRLEKYRRATERWLADRGVQYRHLVMWDLPDKARRLQNHGHGQYKGRVFRTHPWAKLFIESSYDQAVVIAEESKKSVLCIETQELITPKR